MGVCASSDLSAEEQARRQKEKQQNNEIARRITDEHNADQQINKLLLLGAGESGKSTLFKQMITIYGTGYPESERKTFIPIICSNILASAKVLCAQTDVFAPITDPDLLAAKNFIENELKGEEEIDPKIGEYLIALWRSPNVQATFEQRAQYQLTDSTAYFMERIEDVMSANYIPTQQDVLRSRVRTTGIVENEFTIDGNQFKMFDVGGQRNERKKWIHCFENVTAVLFVAAISEYDQVLYEDENTNRITEALNLFEEISNSRWFRETAVILFLNKRDLFRDKIAKVPLSQFFPDYQGDNSFDSCCEYMRLLFESKNRNQEKQIYTHITCATDTENISMVFNAVKDIVIRKSLNEAGLV